MEDTPSAQEFNKFKLTWLETVARDCSSAASHAAVIIAVTYYNRFEKCAWMGPAALGADIGKAERQARAALKELTKAGYLRVRRRRYYNEYEPVLPQRAPARPRQTKDDHQERRNSAALKNPDRRKTAVRPAENCLPDRRNSAVETGGIPPTNPLDGIPLNNNPLEMNPLDTSNKPPRVESKSDDATRLRREIEEVFKKKGAAVPKTERAEVWIAQGYDPKVCLAVVKELVAKSPEAVRSLQYFEQELVAAHAKKAGLPAGAKSWRSDPVEVALRQRRVVEKWAKSTPYQRKMGEGWNDGYNEWCGGPPDSLRCTIPDNILQEFGLKPVERAVVPSKRDTSWEERASRRRSWQGTTT